MNQVREIPNNNMESIHKNTKRINAFQFLVAVSSNPEIFFGARETKSIHLSNLLALWHGFCLREIFLPFKCQEKLLVSCIQDNVLAGLDRSEPLKVLNGELSRFAEEYKDLIENPTYARLREASLDNMPQLLAHMKLRPPMYMNNEPEPTAVNLIFFLIGFWYGIKMIGYPTSVEPSLDSLLAHLLSRFNVDHLVEVGRFCDDKGKSENIPGWDILHADIQRWYSSWPRSLPLEIQT